jgi:hypothetical protein
MKTPHELAKSDDDLARSRNFSALRSFAKMLDWKFDWRFEQSDKWIRIKSEIELCLKKFHVG